MLTLPEDLIILAVGAKPRGGPNNGKLSWKFPYGIRGAMLVAPTLAGRVEVADERIVVRDPTPLGDPNLDGDLARLVASGGAPVGEWMRNTLRAAVTGVDPVEPATTALAGLLYAGDIARLVYPGSENAALRAKLAELAGQEPAMTVPGDRAETDTPDDPFRFAAEASVRSAVHSAIHHSVHAAVSAAADSSHHHSGGSSSGGDSSSHHHH